MRITIFVKGCRDIKPFGILGRLRLVKTARDPYDGIRSARLGREKPPRLGEMGVHVPLKGRMQRNANRIGRRKVKQCARKMEAEYAYQEGGKSR